jgi:hypothetical protein
MSFLKTLQKGATFRPPKAIIYGPPGIGKSTLSCQIPDSIVLDCNDGLDGVPCVRYPARPDEGASGFLFKNMHEVLRAMETLYKEEHDFKALVIDSLTEVQDFIWKQVAQDNNVTSIEGINYGKGYQYAMQYWDQFLGGFSALRDKRGMMIILLCHSETQKYNDPMADSSYDRYNLKLHKLASDKVREGMDAVLFFDQKTYINKEDAGFGKKTSKAAGGSRVLFTSEDPRHVAKNRYNLPAEIPLLQRDQMWETFMATLNKSVSVQPPPKVAEVLPEPPAAVEAVEEERTIPY